MWIAGVSPLEVLEAYIPACVAVVIFGIPASIQQQRYWPIQKHASKRMHVDWSRVTIVALILLAAIAVNIAVKHAVQFCCGQLSLYWGRSMGGDAGDGRVAQARLGSPARSRERQHLPVGAYSVRFIDARRNAAGRIVADRIRTGIRFSGIRQYPPDRVGAQAGRLTTGATSLYAVGFGGSMIWFGSSAGVALASQYPHAKSVGLWLKHGWHIALAYVAGFFVLLAVHGWHPNAPHKASVQSTAAGDTYGFSIGAAIRPRVS
jgi:hypothetical protein